MSFGRSIGTALPEWLLNYNIILLKRRHSSTGPPHLTNTILFLIKAAHGGGQYI